MDKPSTLTILKNAILIERKGKSLYQTAMDHAESDAVKAFFKDLVDDEQEHIEILEKQFKSFMNSGAFLAGQYEGDAAAVDAPDILSEELTKQIGAASFEATAITAAIAFENKAVQMYAQQAKDATDPEEKKLYNWLSVWEKTHLKKLMAIEESLIETAWNDNNFWPF
ncbi:MAG: rubrerythrin [Desulfobacteraceae bacterium]|nr:MAG: rubrerythrin [Desulfobacteraceae bacterium]